MGVSTHSLEVNAPLKAVNNQWTQLKNFRTSWKALKQSAKKAKAAFLESKDRRAGQRMGSRNYKSSTRSKDRLGKYRWKSELRNDRGTVTESPPTLATIGMDTRFQVSP
jgi:hypothetical protein